MSVYVVTHKNIELSLPEEYKIIVVNASNNDAKGDYYDNIGDDNISKKNFCYCELTAVYWLWKNSDDDIIGIDHYRRFFIEDNNLLSMDKIRDILKEYDVITPKKDKFMRNIGTYYCNTSGYKQDLVVLRNAILKKYPEYINDYDSFMNGNQAYSCNMMVMKKKNYDSYCEWLFTILEETEKSIDMNNRKGYYRRIYGFLAERLLNVYLIHNNYTVYESDVLYTGEKVGIVQKVKNKINKIKDKYGK